jgi:uncharacterized protein (DUF2062 family)
LKLMNFLLATLSQKAKINIQSISSLTSAGKVRVRLAIPTLQASLEMQRQLKIREKLGSSLDAIKRGTLQGLRQGISPRRLALTLALGFAIGCIPVVGIPTLVCAALAVALRLNLPAIQAANYAVMPLQLLLIVPFVRLGGWLIASSHNPSFQAGALLHASPQGLATQMGWLAGQALLAWVLIAMPAVLLMTFTLTKVLRRIPALAAAEAGD